MTINKIRHFNLLLSLVLLVACAPYLFAEDWTGQAQCVLTVQGPGYSHQETQTWTVLGGTPTLQGAFRIYPGTWSVSGGGSLTRTVGTQTLQAQWKTNASVANAPVAVFVRPSDNHLILKAWHAQLRGQGGTTLTQQQIVDGVPRPPSTMSIEAFEYQFPAGESVSTSHSLSGSSTIPINGSVSPMTPGGSQGTAACTWQYTLGGVVPPGQNGSNPGSTNPGTSNPGSTNPGTANPGNTNPGNNNPPGGGQNQPPAAAPSFTIGGPFHVSTQWKTDVPQYLTGQNTHWVNGVSVADMGGAGMTAKMSVTDATHATVTVTVDPTNPSFRSGARTMTVRTGSEVVSAAAVSVDDDLFWGGITPNQAEQGSQNVSITITGGLEQLAVTGQPITADFGPGISVVGPVTISNGSNAPVTINIDPAATAGARDVTIRSGALTITGSKALTVNAASTPPGGSKIPVGKTPVGGGPTPVIAQPRITLSPNSAPAGSQALPVTITGNNTHFDQAATIMNFGPNIGWGKTVNSPTNIVASLTIPDNGSTGPVDVVVRTGTEVVTLPQGFTITKSPNSTNPAQGNNLPGGGHAVPSKPLLGSCPAPPSPPPTALATPYCVQQGQQNVTLTLNATGSSQWPQGNYDPSSFGGKGVTVKTVIWNSPTSMTAVADIDPNATLGPHSSWVSLSPTTGECGGSYCVILDIRSLYAVVSAPPANPLTSNPGTTSGNSGSVAANAPANVSTTTAGDWSISLSPTTGMQGMQKLQVNITGVNTHFKQGTTLPNFGPGVGVSPIVSSSTNMIAYLHIPDDAPIGPVDVQVQTGAEVVKLPHGFTITPSAPIDTSALPGISDGSPTQTTGSHAITNIPAITQLTPNSGVQHGNVPVTITGNNLTHFSTSTKADFGVGIVVGPLTHITDNSAQTVLTIAAGTTLGARNVTLTTGNEVARIANGFTVLGSANNSPSSFQISLTDISYYDSTYGRMQEWQWCDITGCSTYAKGGDVAAFAGAFKSGDEIHAVLGQNGTDLLLTTLSDKVICDDYSDCSAPDLTKPTVGMPPSPTAPTAANPIHAWIYAKRGAQHSNLIPVTYGPPLQKLEQSPIGEILAPSNNVAGFGADLTITDHNGNWPGGAGRQVEHRGGAFGGAKGDDIWYSGALNPGWYAVAVNITCNYGNPGQADGAGLGGAAMLTAPLVSGTIHPAITIHWWVNANGYSMYTIHSLTLIGPQGTFPFQVNGH